MTIKKFILGATVCAGLFALTVPSSFVLARECEKCPAEKMTNPCNATCNRCHKAADKCKCKGGCPVTTPCPAAPACPSSCEEEKSPCPSGCAVPCPSPTCEGGCATGCAASIDGKRAYRQQLYAYPNAIYSNANAAFLGDENNAAIVADDVEMAASGLLVTEGSMTGAACEIDTPCPLDALTAKKCPTGPSVSVDSQTSIIVARKFYENYDLPKGMTGAAAGMGTFYPDVPSNFWAAHDINRLSDKCVLFGYPDGLFRPNKNITRAEMATAVVKGYNLEDTALSGSGNFPDVPRNHWAYEMINKGVTTDLIEGHSNGKFAPEQPITMAQALMIISKGCDCPMDECKANEILSQYADGNRVPSWARIGAAKAIESGALKNAKGNSIHPDKNASRAEVATMLQSMRIACGYDSMDNKVAEDRVIRSFVEKEEKIQIPTLELTMNDIINAKNANVGESFAATTVNDICIDGVSYPAGSRVNGKVVEVIRPTKNDQGALRLSFNEIADSHNKNKMDLPKQIMTARVEKTKEVGGFTRLVEFPFTWVGSVLGNTGRTIGGMAIGLSNATENVFDSVGTGTAEILTGKFRAGGRSYQNATKALVMAPVDFTRTAASGVAGAFQTSLDEVAYLVDPSGNRISQVNPKQKMTIAFGE